MYRLSTIDSALRESFKTLESAAEHGTITEMSHKPKREMLEIVLANLKNPKHVPKETVFGYTQEPMRDVFNHMQTHHDTVRRLTHVLVISAVVMIALLSGTWNFQNSAQILLFLIFAALIIGFLYFVYISIAQKTDWEGYWKSKKTEWEAIERGMQTNRSTK